MEWAVRAVGIFYITGGLMLLYQAWLNFRLQRALAGLIPRSLDEPISDALIALGGALVLASGVALALLSTWAVTAFLAGWAIQAAYLLWVSRKGCPGRPGEHRGRLRSVHAFAGYTAVTALVLCLPMLGLLG